MTRMLMFTGHLSYGSPWEFRPDNGTCNHCKEEKQGATITAAGEYTCFICWDCLNTLAPVTIDPLVRHGVPCVQGSRFPVASVLAELAEGYTIAQIAEDYGLDRLPLTQFLQELAAHYDRSFTIALESKK